MPDGTADTSGGGLMFALLVGLIRESWAVHRRHQADRRRRRARLERWAWERSGDPR